MIEGDLANLDVTAPGAILGLALMYLQTHDRSVADTFSVPSSAFELDMVRPDFILLRVLARSLVMWADVRPTDAWLRAQLPPILQVGRRHRDHVTTQCSHVSCIAHYTMLTGQVTPFLHSGIRRLISRFAGGRTQDLRSTNSQARSSH